MAIPLIFRYSLPPKEITVHTKEFYDDIRRYRYSLEIKGLPVIFSVRHLCLLSGVNTRNIMNIVESSRIGSYKRFKLRKKRGGFRVIQTPNEELKYLQRWILYNILEQQPSHTACKGFDKTTCIKQNAEVHLNKESILKLDLLRFYDSITEKQVYRIFKGLGYHGNLAIALAKICTIVPDDTFLKSFKKGEQDLKSVILNHGLGILPQGAPTSPKISNLICLSLDHRLSALAYKNGLNIQGMLTILLSLESIKKIAQLKKLLPELLKMKNYLSMQPSQNY